MTREVLQQALEALEEAEYARTDLSETLVSSAIIALREALIQPVQPDTDMAYTIALQRAIEWHCEGKDVPPDVAELCPYHAEELNMTLAQTEQFNPDWDAMAVLVEEQQRMAKQIAEMQDWEAVAADQAMTIAMMKLEQEPVTEMAALADNDAAYSYADGWNACLRKCKASPPQRQPLTDAEVDLLAGKNQNNDGTVSYLLFARAIQAAHGIGDKT